MRIATEDEVLRTCSNTSGHVIASFASLDIAILDLGPDLAAEIARRTIYVFPSDDSERSNVALVIFRDGKEFLHLLGERAFRLEFIRMIAGGVTDTFSFAVPKGIWKELANIFNMRGEFEPFIPSMLKVCDWFALLDHSEECPVILCQKPNILISH
jgi:hypothetical protein